ncbi:MAG: PP2C family protein-serine/threonine phosphatase [Acidobacteriota bacterium]
MRVEACYITNVGKIRRNNEDSLLLNNLVVSETNLERVGCVASSEERQIYAVADGMGGHQRGEVASRTVLEMLKDKYLAVEDTGDLIDIMKSAKSALNWLVEKDRDSYGLGTTATGLFVGAGRCFLFHCGDSRLYRLKGNVLERLTKDHSLVQRLLEEGVITEEEMRKHPQKNILTSALIGDMQSASPAVEVREVSLSGRETFLLCSDGLWESVSRQDMQECFLPLHGETECLFDKAMASGARDNISMIVVKISDG